MATKGSPSMSGEASQEALFPYFAQFVLERYTEDIKAYRCSRYACCSDLQASHARLN